jgi:hypothetical protein
VEEHGITNSTLLADTGLGGEVDVVAFDPRSTRLALASSYGADQVLILDPHTGRELQRVREIRKVRGLAFLSSEVLLVVQAGICVRYDLRNREITLVWQEEGKAAFGVAASPDGQVAAIGTNWGGIVLYDLARRQVRHSRQTRLAEVPEPRAFSDDGRHVVVELRFEQLGSLSDRLLAVLDAGTGSWLRTYQIGFAQALAFRGQRLGVLDYDRQGTFLYELTGGEDPVEQFPEGCGAGLRFADDGSLEMLGQDGRLVRLQRGKSRVMRPASPPAGWGDLGRFVASPDWSFLVGTSEDKVGLWQVTPPDPEGAGGPRD